MFKLLDMNFASLIWKTLTLPPASELNVSALD